MVQPGTSVCGSRAASPQRTNEDLGNDGTNFARRSGDTVRCRPIPGWEALAGDKEGGGVRTKVEEELAEDVEPEET